MGGSRRKLWTRNEYDAPSDDLQEQVSGESEVEEQLFAVEAEEGATAPLAAEVPVEVESDPAADRSAGEEVDVILETARAAAAKIRASAADEAQQVRADADAYAHNARADADAYAHKARADADVYAEHLRAEAEREAEEIAAAARTRLESADIEVKEKVRQAEEQAQRRTDSLRAESKRHEERLQRVMVVFRGMTSQLEELLEKPTDGEQGDAKEPNDQVEAALEAESARSGVA